MGKKKGARPPPKRDLAPKPKPKAKTVSTTLEDGPPLCMTCNMMNDMAIHLIKHTIDGVGKPSHEIVREFRVLCTEIRDCCGNPFHGSSYYDEDEESATGVFWKNKTQEEEQAPQATEGTENK